MGSRTTPLGFADRLTRAILLSDLSRNQVAVGMGVPRTTFDRLMLHPEQFKIQHVERFAAVTGIEVEWLYVGDAWYAKAVAS